MARSTPNKNETSHWPLSILSSLSSLFGFALPMVMARTLSADDVGSFRIYSLYLSTLPSVTLSVGLVNGLYYWSGRGKEGRSLIQTAWSVLLVLALSITILAITSYPLLKRWDVMPAELWPIFILTLAPTILGNFYEFGTIASGRIWFGSIFTSVADVLRTFAMVVVLIATHSLPAVLVTHLIVLATKVILGQVLALRQGLVERKVSFDKRASVWDYAWPVSIAAVFDLLVISSDRLILSQFITSEAFAFYSIGCLAVPPLAMLEQAVNRVLIPRMSAHFGQGRSDLAAWRYREAMSELGMIMIPAVAGLVVFSREIITLLFTVKYASSALYLQVFAFFYLALIVPFDSVARATGRSRWILGLCVSFGIYSLVAAGLLTWRFGPMGSLAALLSTQLLQRGYSLWSIHQTQNWRWRDFVPFFELAVYTAASLTLSALCLAVKPLFHSMDSTGQNRPWLFICGILFLTIYLSGAFIWKKGRPQPHLRGQVA